MAAVFVGVPRQPAPATSPAGSTKVCIRARMRTENPHFLAARQSHATTSTTKAAATTTATKTAAATALAVAVNEPHPHSAHRRPVKSKTLAAVGGGDQGCKLGPRLRDEGPPSIPSLPADLLNLTRGFC